MITYQLVETFYPKFCFNDNKITMCLITPKDYLFEPQICFSKVLKLYMYEKSILDLKIRR